MPEKPELVTDFAEYALPVLRTQEEPFSWAVVERLYEEFSTVENVESQNIHEEILAGFQRQHLETDPETFIGGFEKFTLKTTQ